MSGERELEVFFQEGMGGRTFERPRPGTQHEWKQVTVWEPLARLAYKWHLGLASEDATDVEIRFVSGR